ncbi:PilZ domain-containing protein [Erythrobacter sp. HKB08]|uniref:PilZ domain-containing protein n=1 Tax=Erythrobacter sp. HKB08 TaxID=2502843 RepID=UPI001009084A
MEMRSYNRFSTDQEIECAVDGKRGVVKLYNLSCGGCMIETPDEAIDEGTQIRLRLQPKVIVNGRVVWRIEKNAGIKFETPLHQTVVEQFGYVPNSEFDRDDPRDRFGLPLIG